MTMNDSDLARLLQEEYDREVAFSLDDDIVTNTQKDESTSDNKHKFNQVENQNLKPVSTPLTPGLSPVDPSLELTDPNPDIRLMFLQFNTQFFWNKLSGIEVKWSPRMTLCAGLCVYEGRGGLCSVRLSLPLLKLRPRKDLVETLLHEMIHAYLFVTHNDSDHSDHGPNFLSHMHRINKSTGAGISVYHTFHDEVESYQQHWWRCNGPCQKRAPYYGYVKRSMNRAPSPRDNWWGDHQASCGGAYTKIKEPEGYGQKKSGKGKTKEDKSVDLSKDIRTFWGQGHTLGSSSTAIKKIDNTFVLKGRTSIHSDNGIGRGSSSNVVNQFSGKTLGGGAVQSFTPHRNSLFSVIKPVTNHSTSISANGSDKALTDATFKQEISASPTSKHIQGSGVNNKTTDMTKKLPGESLLNHGSRNSFDHHSTIDLTLSDANKSRTKPRVGGKHNKILEGNSLRKKINKRWKNTPQVNSKKVLFPKNFVSVCEGGEFPNPVIPKKKKKMVYIIDDLDSNDGLWEESEDNKAHITYTQSSVDNNDKTSTAENTGKSAVILNRRLDANTMNNEPEDSSLRDSDSQKKNRNPPSESKTNKIVSSDWLVKSGDASRGSHTPSSVTTEDISSNGRLVIAKVEGKTGSFTGDGQTLDTGEGGTSFLSQIRKNWLKGTSSGSRDPSGGSRDPSGSKPSQSSSIDRQSSMSQISRASVRSPLPARKRTSDEAFGEQDSDMNTQIDKVVRSSATHNVFDNRMRNVIQGSVHEMSSSASHNDTSSPDDMVPCPSCTIKVSMSEINAHLDLCLI